MTPDALFRPGAGADSERLFSAPRFDAPYALTLPHRDHTAGFFIARLRRS